MADSTQICLNRPLVSNSHKVHFVKDCKDALTLVFGIANSGSDLLRLIWEFTDSSRWHFETNPEGNGLAVRESLQDRLFTLQLKPGKCQRIAQYRD
ncbi:MAG UNVERIFIED_CONTAM: hypothetical protein LVR29_12250 [Microcystis novacekii LVE1205-3]|jgi:hypothetical protein